MGRGLRICDHGRKSAIWTMASRQWHKRAARTGGKAFRQTRRIVAMTKKSQRFGMNRTLIAGWAGLALCGVLVAGCADNDQMAAQYIERPIEQIYADAWLMIDRENWLEAGRQFDEVERQHPYS